VSNLSRLTAGIPEGPTTVPDPERFVFEYVPDLWDLLPATDRSAGAGWPGVKYAQVCVHNAKRARDHGLRAIHGTEMYTVRGPSGDAHMTLMGLGEVIPGASPEAGARELFFDGEMGRLTGHRIDPEWELWFTEQPGTKPAEEPFDAPVNVTSSAGAVAQQAGRGDARVQARQPAQRQPARPEGDQPPAGSGDRAERTTP